MTGILQISEAIKNGIKHLEEERIFGAGTELHQANRKQRIALLRGNERAANYWGEIAAICRMLEQKTPQTEIITPRFAD